MSSTIFYWFQCICNVRTSLVSWIGSAFLFQSSSDQLLSHVWLFATPWISGWQASLPITTSQSLLKLMPIESLMPSSLLIFCRPLLLLPLIPARVFFNVPTLGMRWPKYWSFSFSISPSNEYPGLISFRMDWSVFTESHKLNFSNNRIPFIPSSFN